MSARSGRPILETLALFVIVYLLQQVAFVVGGMVLVSGLFVLEPPIERNAWTIVTSVYAHDPQGIAHLLSNSVGLVLFGWPIARATTRLRFHAFFVITGSLAALSQIWVVSVAAALSDASAGGVLGASGAVFALMGYLLAGNRLSEGIAARVDVPTWLTFLIFVVLAAGITIATAAPRVALVAHFTGFLLGLIAGRAGVLETGPQPRAERPAPRSR